MRTTFRALLLFAVFVSEVLGFVTYSSSSSSICSSARRLARCTTRLSNDESGEALEQAAAKLRKEVADLEKELAKGKKQDENVPPETALDLEMPSSPFSLAPSRWLVMMDIGREKGTWMPQSWGRSGRRVEVDLLVQFLPGGDMKADVDSPFVDMTVTPGKWSVGAAQGKPRRRPTHSLGSLTSDTCRFWVETDGFGRGDVTIPAGRIYFAVPAWGGKLSRKGLVTVRQRRWLVREESRILGVFGTELLVPDAEGRLPPRTPRPRTPPFPDGFRDG
ncbi:unnamed protein product [Ectocarpus sp. 4 AP-2014]